MTGLDLIHSTEALDNSIRNWRTPDAKLYLAKDLYERRHLLREHQVEMILDETLEPGAWRRG